MPPFWQGLGFWVQGWARKGEISMALRMLGSFSTGTPLTEICQGGSTGSALAPASPRHVPAPPPAVPSPLCPLGPANPSCRRHPRHPDTLPKGPTLCTAPLKPEEMAAARASLLKSGAPPT